MLDRLRIGAVPVLVATGSSPKAAAARGTVLLYHPLGKDKSLHVHDLERLAAAGLLAIGVDAIAHGERHLPEGAARFRADPLGALLEVVSRTVAEIPRLLDALEQRGWAVPGRIGVAGVSLGGFVAYGAAVTDRRIAAAACLTASPSWGPDPRSPDRHPDRFFPLALLSVTAARDALVSPGPVRALHAMLGPRYAAAPERLRYVELPGESHHLSAAGEARAREEADRWMTTWLAQPRPAADDLPVS